MELRAESEEGEGIFDEAQVGQQLRLSIVRPSFQVGVAPSRLSYPHNFIQDPEFESALSHLSKFFSDVHHIQVSEDSLEEEVDWITECLARLYIHSRLYQCSR